VDRHRHAAGFSPEHGYEGLITGKRAAVIYVSGVYSPGVPLAFGADFHSTYFNDWLRFAGFAGSDVVEVRF
jgi:FMN-dependent NADH-azoreductase